MSSTKKPLVLTILDGYGHREEQQDNAILNAKTPVMDRLWQQQPHTLIAASGLDVGLPDGQMGNSEVGHVNLGAGRIVYQDLTRLDKEIKDGDFFTNPILTAAVDKAVKAGKAVHIMGLLSAGGVHSHEDHILAMVELAAKRGATAIYLHAFLDGRDTPPRSAEPSLKRFTEKFAALGKGRIASIIGRYYAMDRDNRWDRVQLAYDLLTQAKGEFTADNAVAGLQAAYARNENDEFVKPTVIQAAGEPDAAMDDGDALIFMNFRADRARQITRTFVNADFDGFKRDKVVNFGDFIMLTEYAADIKVACAYPPASLENTFGEWLMKHDKTQLRISETEKYAHVTFFYNGGVEEPFKGEDRILINSPKVATYDLQPEMSSAELTEKLVGAIASGKYDVIICNYPNGDMVGHTGDYDAAVKAVETLDNCIEQVVAAVKAVDGQLLITADHGNAEQMRDPATGQAHTAHTSLPVPLIYVGNKEVKAVEGGKLSDIAPTMLSLMEMEIPQEMTGKPLFIVE
ncbi:2,3-bisphosphoglycerate-independent phosphoglycerate mutase [Yersinia enterocolitica]|nr:2,3-bisphosphoglycerate-independent phosphoglycerate mutase [Yersinia enterocolitica]HDM8093052.1 2,3-bisphosphoglycerate-independent phosphoglycerate mutase [Yersinia enterocolitica]